MHGGHHRVDVEWLALRAGLKPGIRIAATALEASQIAAHFQRLGATVVTARGPVGAHRHELTLLYVAREAAHAASLRAAERPLLQPQVPARDKAFHCKELGLRLGYPRCCIDAFAARVLRGPGRLRAGDRDAHHEDYVAARDAQVARPDWRLNNLLLRQNLRLITFEPCRYDCAAALAYAGGVLRIVAAVEPRALPGLQDSLQRPLALLPTGGRAWVSLAGGELVRAEAPRERPGAAAEPDDLAAAAHLTGARASGTGPVAGRGEPPPLLLDFTPT